MPCDQQKDIQIYINSQRINRSYSVISVASADDIAPDLARASPCIVRMMLGPINIPDQHLKSVIQWFLHSISQGRVGGFIGCHV